MPQKAFVQLAKEAMQKAYAPYSGYKVGAALLCADGTVYQGCNIENASFTPTICAERVAFFKAIYDGHRDFKAIAVCGGKDGEITGAFPPCGVCRQVIIAREIDKDPKLLIAVQPTRGMDVGAIEYAHKQIVAQRDAGKAVLLVSLELDEVMTVSDRILVMYEGEIVGELDPKKTTVEELGLYMAGAKKEEVK